MIKLFKKEKEMLLTVYDWLSPQVTSIETEFGCGYCSCYVPDIVGVVFDMAEVAKLKRQRPIARSRTRQLIAEKRIPKLFHSDLIAVELKLKNFVEAYFQAKIYQSFGFKTYIAMPEPVYRKLPAIRVKVMMYDGIGFITVGEQCKVRIEAKPSLTFNLEDEIQIVDRLICRYRGKVK